ncbi:hypothetical protein Gohar_027348 [Gossypium harknessii]|uniref:Uncharacterized protein n=1 Tax=Gossypium harknessii TaxID=34285 RepID=A0A7J9HUZ2_9ROSI|nr:hypothetical protein [Gossypium harknessii]
MCSDYANKPSEYFRDTLTLLPNFKNLRMFQFHLSVDLGFKPRSKVGDILKSLRDNKYKCLKLYVTVKVSCGKFVSVTETTETKLSTAPIGWGVELAIPKLPTSFYLVVLEGRML